MFILFIILCILYVVQIIGFIVSIQEKCVTTKREFWEWIIPFFRPIMAVKYWYNNLK